MLWRVRINGSRVVLYEKPGIAVKKLALLVVMLIPLPVFAAQNAYLWLTGETQDAALVEAEKGYAFHKARGAREIAVNTKPRSSTDKRKQSLYFPENMSGFFLSPDNELLNVRKGRVVSRMKVRPSVKRIALPEVEDEVLVGAEGADKKKLPTKKKKPHK